MIHILIVMADKLHDDLNFSTKSLVPYTKRRRVKNCETCALQEASESEFEQGVPENPLAMVPYQKLDGDDDACSYSITVGDSKQSKPGWSFLRQVFHPRKHSPKSSMKNSFVLQRALPSYHSSAVVHPDDKEVTIEQNDGSTLDGVSGAIVPFGSTSILPAPSFCSDLNSLPDELMGLQEKYSSSCRIYSLQELVSATGNFSTG